MKVINFDYKSDEFGLLMNDMQALHEEVGIDTLICVYKKKDGTVGFGTTRGNDAEFLGLMEMAKAQLIETLYEND